MSMFNEKIFQGMHAKITDAILKQITADRDGEAINKDTVKKSIAIFVDIGLIKPKPMRTLQGTFLWQGENNLSVYDECFEALFLAATQHETLQSASLWNSTRNCPEYLKEVQKFLANEENNADYWLQPETKTKMLKIAENELITKMAEAVSSKDTGCVHMFEQKNLQELKLLFEVFKRDQTTFGLIIQKMNPYILSRGEKIVMDETNVKDPHLFTEKLLDFKAEIDELVSFSFSNQMMFQKARDNSFQEFMNQQQFTPIYIAQFSDREFRSGLKGLSDLDVHKRLDAIINLFRCLHGRDVFIKQYAKELGSRLLNKTSIS